MLPGVYAHICPRHLIRIQLKDTPALLFRAETGRNSSSSSNVSQGIDHLQLMVRRRLRVKFAIKQYSGHNLLFKMHDKSKC